MKFKIQGGHTFSDIHDAIDPEKQVITRADGLVGGWGLNF